MSATLEELSSASDKLLAERLERKRQRLEQPSEEYLGKLRKDMTVSPGSYGVGRIAKGQILRIIDVEGQEAADFCSFNQYNPREHLSCIYTGCHSTHDWQWSTG